MVTEEQGISAQKLIDSLNYYTPSVEDLRVGYEFEYNAHHTYIKSDWEKEVIKPEWYGMNYDSGWDSDPTITFYMGMLRSQPKNFRVPYLKKEQIKSEGWVEDTDHPIYKGLLRMKTDKATYWLRIIDKSNIRMVRYTKPDPNNIWEMQQRSIIYDGNCPSINEFRTICKLLNI